MGAASCHATCAQFKNCLFLYGNWRFFCRQLLTLRLGLELKRRQKCLAPMETTGDNRRQKRHQKCLAPMETTGAKAVTKSAWHRWRQPALKCRQKCLAPMATTGAKTSPKVPGTDGDNRRQNVAKSAWHQWRQTP